MRRTRTLLAMVLALGMAADALVSRAPTAEMGQRATTAMIVPIDRDHQGSADRESDEDEVVAVDAERRFITVDVER